MLNFLRTRQWVMARRIILIGIILFLAYRTYGDGLLSLFVRPSAKRDIVITKTEFRADITERPVWIIGFRNSSRRYAYDQIQLEANYFDKDGSLLQKDKLVVYQRLDPLQEKTIASADFKPRGAATNGSLAVLDAQRVR